MASFFLVLSLLLLAALFVHPIALAAHMPNPTSRITVVGVVYCDTCLTNTFSAHSYFLPGADVHIECTFRASSPRTNERMLISVNRTTDKHGIYELEVPQVDGVDCVDGFAIATVCQAGLIRSSSRACNNPGLKTSTNEISVKSKQDNLCIYSLSALNYRPLKRNATLCGNKKEELQTSFNSSKFFLPYLPPYRFPWPPMFQLQPFPPFPFPPLPPLPPFPPVPNFPPAPSLFHPPPPPAFNIGDPRTWIPNFPPLVPSPPPPPSFNLGDPRTWTPNFPPLVPSPPPPPSFNLGDPRTWTPNFPPLVPSPPPPPSFNLGDPRTWTPNFPPLLPSPPPRPPSLPPPPTFNLGDPRTWTPNFPPLLPSPPPRPPSPPPPPPPPTFNPGDPRTWIPYNPPSPPSIPQNQNP